MCHWALETFTGIINIQKPYLSLSNNNPIQQFFPSHQILKYFTSADLIGKQNYYFSGIEETVTR